MREVERRESNWAGRVKIGRTTGPFYNAVFRSPLSFSTEPQRTGSGHGDEAGKDEEDESEAHGGVEGWGVRGWSGGGKRKAMGDEEVGVDFYTCEIFVTGKKGRRGPL
jgi:hypothetical protein